ncbi:alanine racemase C-terminal domain-containing protein [Microbacterium sp. 10M-3C3]|uniref:alanine racemase C-terminal domain-containing protein n=1 Tax=Microbacterium sp. 10M-3C3 TaxID=2483401 RepID=UPI000F643ED6|nr:alanine racemase C-terminal domain-containing protein [Microbacterium sp. 10M-3C3]
MDERHAGPPSGTGTTALLSRAALRRNLDLARAGTPSDTPALACDAWGHGEQWVRDTLGAAADDALDALTLYGLPGGDPDAVPALTLRGRVLSTKPLMAGEGVSYGYAHRAAADTRIALVTGGYAQGVVRMLGGRVDVDIAGALHRLVGRIAMDVSVVDIGDTVIERGAVVTYFGDPRTGAPSLGAWTHATGWSAAELIALAGARATREDSP